MAATNLLAVETASASPTLVSSTIQLGSQTLTQSMPGTTDLSHLEPLVRPEITSMIGTKAIFTTFVGIAALAGLAGMGGGNQDDGVAVTGRTGATLLSTKAATVQEGGATVAATSSAEAEPVTVVLSPSASAKREKTVAAGESSSPVFTSYPSNVRPSEKWLYETMEEDLKSVEFSEGMTLDEVLSDLAMLCTASHGKEQFEMQIWPDRMALEDIAIDSLEDLSLTRDISLTNVSVQNAINLILQNIAGSDGETLTVVVQNEIVKLTTETHAESERYYYLRAYPVAQLLDLSINSSAGGNAGTGGGGYGGGSVDGGGSGGYGGSGGGGGLFNVLPQKSQSGASSDGGIGSDPKQPSKRRAGAGGTAGGQTSGYGDGASKSVAGLGIRGGSDRGSELVDLVMNMTRPPAVWQDYDDEGGTIAVVGDRLVVRQSASVHREIAKLLNLLTEKR